MMYQFALLVLLPLVCHGGLIGGNTDIKIDASDPNVVFALNAINDYYMKQGDNSIRTLVTIVKAQSQVVAGTLYHFTLRIQVGTETELCKVAVWSRPWLSAQDSTQLSADPECKSEMVATAAPMPGGEYDVDMNSAEVLNALNFATDSMNAQENNMYRRKATGATKVTAQVVAGMLYRFRGVSMANSQCTKGDNKLLSECQVLSGAHTVMCDFDVSWQAWMTPAYTLMNFKCQ